jgi:hypothetical protein
MSPSPSKPTWRLASAAFTVSAPNAASGAWYLAVNGSLAWSSSSRLAFKNCPSASVPRNGPVRSSFTIGLAATSNTPSGVATRPVAEPPASRWSRPGVRVSTSVTTAGISRTASRTGS